MARQSCLACSGLQPLPMVAVSRFHVSRGCSLSQGQTVYRYMSLRPQSPFLSGNCYQFHQHGLFWKSSLPQQQVKSRMFWDSLPTTQACCSYPRHLFPRHATRPGLVRTSPRPFTKEVDTAPPRILLRTPLRLWSTPGLKGKEKQQPCQVCLTPACFPHCLEPHQPPRGLLPHHSLWWGLPPFQSIP